MHELDELDWEIRGIYASLPEASKKPDYHHDGYRYLASTYGLSVAGFVTPVAGSEPSIQQRQATAAHYQGFACTGHIS